MAQKLSPMMVSVLASIAWPHPDDEPFPPAGTVKALAKRGLIKFVTITKPKNAFEILCGRQFDRLRVSRDGLAALKEAGVSKATAHERAEAQQ